MWTYICPLTLGLDKGRMTQNLWFVRISSNRGHRAAAAAAAAAKTSLSVRGSSIDILIERTDGPELALSGGGGRRISFEIQYFFKYKWTPSTNFIVLASWDKVIRDEGEILLLGTSLKVYECCDVVYKSNAAKQGCFRSPGTLCLELLFLARRMRTVKEVQNALHPA